MSGTNQRVSMQLLLILYLVQSTNVYLNICLSPKVGITRTILYCVTYLFAAKTPHMSSLHLSHLLLLFFSAFFFFLLLGFMLTELTARHIFPSLATAPPHFASPGRLMCPTWPVEVFLFIELFRTFFACLLLGVDLPASLSDFHQSLLQFIFVLKQSCLLLLYFHHATNQRFVFILQLLIVLLKSCNFLFVRNCKHCVLY